MKRYIKKYTLALILILAFSMYPLYLVFGTAINNAGASPTASVASDGETNGGASSACAWWVARTAPDIGVNDRIVNISSADSDTLTGFGITPGGGVVRTNWIRTKNAIASQSVERIFTPEVGRWYHYCYTYDGTTLTAYMDGVATGTVAASGNGNDGLSDVVDVCLGCDSAAADFTVSNLVVYNVEISAEKVAQLYRSSPPRNDLNLIGFWRLNEGQGTTLVDSSNNSTRIGDMTASSLTWEASHPPLAY